MLTVYSSAFNVSSTQRSRLQLPWWWIWYPAYPRIIQWVSVTVSSWDVYIIVKSIDVRLFMYLHMQHCICSCVFVHVHYICVHVLSDTFKLLNAFAAYLYMHSHALHCVCVYNVHFCVCTMTDIVKNGWLGRLYTWMYMCLCVPGEPCSVTVLTGWGVSEHLSQGHLQHSRGLDRLTPLSDLCLVLQWAPQALSLLASACASPLGKILSGLVYKKAVGDTYVTHTPTSWRAQYQLSNTVKMAGLSKLYQNGCLRSQTDVKTGLCMSKHVNS